MSRVRKAVLKREKAETWTLGQGYTIENAPKFMVLRHDKMGNLVMSSLVRRRIYQKLARLYRGFTNIKKSRLAP